MSNNSLKYAMAIAAGLVVAPIAARAQSTGTAYVGFGHTSGTTLSIGAYTADNAIQALAGINRSQVSVDADAGSSGTNYYTGNGTIVKSQVGIGFSGQFNQVQLNAPTIRSDLSIDAMNNPLGATAINTGALKYSQTQIIGTGGGTQTVGIKSVTGGSLQVGLAGSSTSVTTGPLRNTNATIVVGTPATVSFSNGD